MTAPISLMLETISMGYYTDKQYIFITIVDICVID